MTFVYVGVLLNSALYLTGCFTAGLLVQNPFAWRLALAAAGVTYLGYVAQNIVEGCRFGLVTEAWNRAVKALVIVSMVLGAAAGLVLL